MESNQKETVIIRIGELYATNKPTVIQTVLGSCVAVCLFDTVNRIGGMNHIFLPGNSSSNIYDTSFRYGENAMKYLIKRVLNLGGERKSLVAKAFGGANVLPSISENLGVGPRIVDFVLDYLEKEKIEIIAHDLGGNKSRKVFFHTDTGMAHVRRFIHKYQ